MISKLTGKLCLRGTWVTAKLSGSEGTPVEGRREKSSAGLKIDGADGDNEKQQNRMEARLKGALPAVACRRWRRLDHVIDKLELIHSFLFETSKSQQQSHCDSAQVSLPMKD